MIPDSEVISMVCEERDAWKQKATDLREVIYHLRQFVAEPEIEGSDAIAKLNTIRKVLA